MYVCKFKKYKCNRPQTPINHDVYVCKENEKKAKTCDDNKGSVEECKRKREWESRAEKEYIPNVYAGVGS